MFVYNFHRCFGNHHEIVHACVGVCGGGGGGSCTGGLGEYEDATIHEVWDGSMKKETFKLI